MTHFEFILCVMLAMMIFLGFAMTLVSMSLGNNSSRVGAIKLFQAFVEALRKLFQ
jgi:hypothetical protein